MKRLQALLAVAGAFAGLGGCATNPVTGQQDFVLMSETQELGLGSESHAEVLKEYGEYDDPALQRYVQQTGERLAATSHRADLVYRFTVLDSQEVNAFALPGGYIYITRGLLAHLNSEAELAAVLGHEIGHVTARHSVRQYTATQAAGIGATIGAIFLPELRTAAGNQLVNVFGTALLRGYGREHELEADRLGAQYIARQGYQPLAMIDVLRTLKGHEQREIELARREGREPRAYHGIFSTHPDSDTRLKEVVGEANALRPAGMPQLGREQFLAAIDGLIVGDSPREGFARGDSFYHPQLQFALRFPAGWTIKNRPDRLLFLAPQGAAMLQLTAEDLNKRLAPRDYLTDRLRLSGLFAEGAISPAGLPGHSAVAKVTTPAGRREMRFAVVYWDNKAYIFAGAVDERANIAVYDTAFLDTIRSFHPIGPREQGLMTPLRIHLATVTPGMSFQALARESPLPNDAEAQLRLLNWRYPAGEPQPGEVLKLIR